MGAISPVRCRAYGAQPPLILGRLKASATQTACADLFLYLRKQPVAQFDHLEVVQDIAKLDILGCGASAHHHVVVAHHVLDGRQIEVLQIIKDGIAVDARRA